MVAFILKFTQLLWLETSDQNYYGFLLASIKVLQSLKNNKLLFSVGGGGFFFYLLVLKYLNKHVCHLKKNSNQKEEERPGEMAQQLTCLPYKYKYLGSNPCNKKLIVAVGWCKPLIRALGGSVRWISECKTSLVYTASSEDTRDTVRACLNL